MHSIAMFNNKGGVGKTTLTCNIAHYLATRKNKRVLVADCDPQCNSTQLIMGEEYAADLYWDRSNRPFQVTTIRDVLQPIADGDSDIDTDIQPIGKENNRFGVDLLPGDPGFSIIEDRLGAAWHELQGGDIGGIRKTNWNTSFCSLMTDAYDLIFFDLGPSLGSINRSVLVGCDKFVTPMGADIFSILGIRNIGTWIHDWMKLYKSALTISEQRNPGRLAHYAINNKLRIGRGYLGYTMQQYITKKTREGSRRPTRAYETILSNVPKVVSEAMSEFLGTNTEEGAKLGDVPHLYSLIPLAQAVAAPILDLQSADNLVGAQYKQKEDYGQIIQNVSERILVNIEGKAN